MTQSTPIPFTQSPFSANFQHMDSNEFAKICQTYNRSWTQEGLFPYIELPAAGPFKEFVPKMYICTSWSAVGKTLLQEGTIDEGDIRDLSVLVPKGQQIDFYVS